eukprot:TRINITY_DN3812_c0_g1_i1.p1 TRINITY_DN3812_c0_g1~~TRINITY_DN3812_c0_g1_i1.p1  ORF type:complete len:368 (+),score=73.49 TRINITY_DN3812_c0_g1_i1:90-1193(+)
MEALQYSAVVCPTPHNVCKLLRQPKLWLALSASLPCALIAGVLKYIQNHHDLLRMGGVINDKEAFQTLTFFVLFVASFRIEAAYIKFWEGCNHAYNIGGDIFDGCAEIFAFTRMSKAAPGAVQDFQQNLIRLCSLLNALIFSELETGADQEVDIASDETPTAYTFELLDVGAIDANSMDKLMFTENKVEMTFQWINHLIFEAWHKDIFSIPAPMLPRALADLGSALKHFHEAQKLTEVPFPFPYVLALQMMLVAHWCITPIVTAEWTEYATWAAAFSFGSTFSLWFFVGIALDLDMPFSFTKNSVDVRYLQRMLNRRLTGLAYEFQFATPRLGAEAKLCLSRADTGSVKDRLGEAMVKGKSSDNASA